MSDVFETVVVCVINGKTKMAGHQRTVFLIGKNRSDDTGGWPGLWHIPGGKIKPGETSEEAVVREALEKTGLLTVVRRCVCTSTRQRRIDPDTVKHDWQQWFDLEVLPESGQAKAGDDLEGVRWVIGFDIRHFISDELVDNFPPEVYGLLEIQPE